MKLQNKNLKAFTLVELIVVITILAILSTIGFVSYSSYLAGTRDSNRISQLKAISEGLKLYSTNHSLPTPDTTSTSIMDNGTQIATQGYAGSNVLETITYSTEGVDPKDKTYFSYYLTQDKKYFQLMAFLEEEDNLQNTAIGIDYSTRHPTVFGDKLGILTTSTNEPIQETLTTIDIGSNLTEEYISYLKDGEYVTGSGVVFSGLTKIAKAGGRGYESDSNHYGFLWTDLEPIDCPTGFIPVSADGEFTTKDFCVAKYEMTYIDADTANSCDTQDPTACAANYDRNTVRYIAGKSIVSQAGKYPIVNIKQSEAIIACKSIGGHLITNNEWMTIARGIEGVSINWSSGKVGNGNLYNGVSSDITLGCDAEGGNGDSRTHATTTGAGSDELCNLKRSHRLYNGQEIWDLSGNVREHVNKANTIDGSGYDTDTNPDISATNNARGEWSAITQGYRDLYGPSIAVDATNGIGKIYQADGTIFVRGATAISGSAAGVFTLNLGYSPDHQGGHIGFRCVR